MRSRRAKVVTVESVRRSARNAHKRMACRVGASLRRVGVRAFGAIATLNGTDRSTGIRWPAEAETDGWSDIDKQRISEIRALLAQRQQMEAARVPRMIR